ncbi:hypothetical protein DFH08DRAFT_1073694 [Mycena albidolilacea]|uniref:Uncharacterized protein n=1 Tax=Mycena albidolilacea TaxID=1033008 RepID=A0AAD7AN65_9AGAR|nr:hypothetical protein DFH08DRAFT_1073694 [Mycena albidolilacea]
MSKKSRSKSKNKEVQQVQQDINEMIEDLSPEVRNKLFAYKPHVLSSHQQENYSPISSPAKPDSKRRADATPAVKAEPIDLSLDSDIEISSPPRKKRRDLLLRTSWTNWMTNPLKSRNAKPILPKTTTLGPYEFRSSVTYPDFLAMIAKACQTRPENLSLSSMQWRFDRPNNAACRPLTTEIGLKVAIKSLAERKKDYDFTAYMCPPSLVLVKKELPWIREARNDNTPSPLDFDYTIEELSAPGSSILSVREQIAGIDNASNPHFNELLERYPGDNHPSFPGKRIFHNEMGYFDLNYVKLRVWAVAMAKQSATVDRPPSTAPTITPSLPAPAASVPALSSNDAILQLLLPTLQAIASSHHSPYGLGPHHYPHQYPPFGAPGPPPPEPVPVRCPVSPPVVLPRVITLDEYCVRYQVNEDDRRVLAELGYEPGDNGLQIKRPGKQ